MPNQSGVWTLSQQFQALGSGLWPKPPGAPTIGTASGISATSASVAFTAPTCTGYPAGVSSYTVTSTPGCVTASGAASPITVTGLTTNTAYTFKVKALGTNGLFGACSAASNSVTPIAPGQQAYTTAGTYSWVAPAGVTSVSMVAVGGGSGGTHTLCAYGYGAGGGGALAYVNNVSVTPGETLTVTVGSGGAGSNNITVQNSGSLSEVTRLGTGLVRANGGNTRSGGTVSVGTGGAGGTGGKGGYLGLGGGGGGAGGYAGAGGNGACQSGVTTPTAGVGGGGGGGSLGAITGKGCCTIYGGGGAGGGVGILGQGSNGSAAATSGAGGGGGSSGNTGGSGTTTTGGTGGSYGGGGGGGGYSYQAGSIRTGGPGSSGAVRIIWPGTTRQFPSTCTGNL